MVEIIIIIVIALWIIFWNTLYLRLVNMENRHEIIQKRIYKKLSNKLLKENRQYKFILWQVRQQAKQIRLLKKKQWKKL